MRSPIGVGLGLLVLGGGGSIAGSQWSLVLLGVGLGMIVGSAMQAGEMSKEMAKNERGGGTVQDRLSGPWLKRMRVPRPFESGASHQTTLQEAMPSDAPSRKPSASWGLSLTESPNASRACQSPSLKPDLSRLGGHSAF